MCLGKCLGPKNFRNVFSIFGSRTRIGSKRVLNWSAYVFKKAFQKMLRCTILNTKAPIFFNFSGRKGDMIGMGPLPSGDGIWTFWGCAHRPTKNVCILYGKDAI